jgi:hypothetical protein
MLAIAFYQSCRHILGVLSQPTVGEFRGIGIDLLKVNDQFLDGSGWEVIPHQIVQEPDQTIGIVDFTTTFSDTHLGYLHQT